jgi:hypothetical protein
MAQISDLHLLEGCPLPTMVHGMRTVTGGMAIAYSCWRGRLLARPACICSERLGVVTCRCSQCNGWQAYTCAAEAA